MAVRLRKPKKPIVKGTGPFWVSTGTIHSQGEPISCKTDDRARTVAGKPFRDMKIWCQRHNSAGVDACDRALVEINNTPIGLEPKKVSAVVDEHTGLTVEVRLWRK